MSVRDGLILRRYFTQQYERLMTSDVITFTELFLPFLGAVGDTLLSLFDS